MHSGGTDSDFPAVPQGPSTALRVLGPPTRGALLKILSEHLSQDLKASETPQAWCPIPAVLQALSFHKRSLQQLPPTLQPFIIETRGGGSIEVLAAGALETETDPSPRSIGRALCPSRGTRVSEFDLGESSSKCACPTRKGRPQTIHGEHRETLQTVASLS